MMNSLPSEEVHQLQIENHEVGLALDEAVEILEDTPSCADSKHAHKQYESRLE